MTARIPRRRKLDDPTGEVREHLREWYAIARTVRGWTPLDHPARRISLALTELLADFYDDGVSCWNLDDLMGAARGTTRARLARHGYRTLPPSQKPYRSLHVRPRGSKKGPRVDITGQRHYRLTAVEWTGQSNPLGALWRFRCDCGRERIAATGQVRGGKVKECQECARPKLKRRREAA